MSGREVANAILVDSLNRWDMADALKSIEREHETLKPGWYAGLASIGLRTGPLKTEKAARECMRLTASSRAAQRLQHGTDYPHPFDLLVWKEK